MKANQVSDEAANHVTEAASIVGHVKVLIVKTVKFIAHGKFWG